jgi:mannose-6-phosphate isomerase-like protein (cupin superfamily)
MGGLQIGTLTLPRFDRCNLDELTTERSRAHGGNGCIDFVRVASADDLDGACNFIDQAVLDPGVSIGRHRHGAEEEEFYLVLSGHGTMWRDGDTFSVRAGDLIRNRPSGEHGLENTGDEPLRLFVFELALGS